MCEPQYGGNKTQPPKWELHLEQKIDDPYMLPHTAAMNFSLSGILLILLMSCPVNTVAALHTLSARPTVHSPRIDGRLDDAVWKEAPFFNEFTQQSPNPLSVPDEQTEIAVAFDHSRLYVAVRCRVSASHTVRSRKTRRDRDGDFDKVEILISPINDGKTAFSFIVNPDGIQQDGAWSEDATFDRNWDAVWFVSTTRSENEWTAEFAIPLNQLRFSRHTPYFGFQVKRWIAHLHELVVFNPKEPDEAGEVSRAGRLTNTMSMSPSLPLSLTPEFYASYTQKDNGSDRTSPTGFEQGAGGYIKAGISPGWTMDAALTPDFGEVEVDKATVNLSNIETVYTEKRPFFLENRQLFTTPIQLFYSRRLGQQPVAPDVNDNQTVIEGPRYTPILLASKFSGTSGEGLSFGVLHVLSEPTRYMVKNHVTNEKLPMETSPWTHDAVLRVSKQFSSGNNAGVLTTSHLPTTNEDAAYTGGIDWNVFWADKEYAFKGQAAASAVQEENSHAYDSGLGAWAWVGRQGGKHFRTSMQYDYRSRDFNPNHLGYLDRSDIHKATYNTQFLISEQRKHLYELYTGLETYLAWNTEGLNLQRQLNLYISIKWRNRMWTHLGGYGKLDAYDDMEFADGPPLKRIPGGGTWVGWSTAEDRPFGFRFDGNIGTDDTGYYFILTPVMVLRMGRVELELNARIVRAKNRESYGDTVERDFYDEYILAKRNLLEFDTGLKGTFVVYKNLTAELNSQLLSSKAHYHDFRQLHDDSHISATSYRDSPDFGTTVLVVQALLRYEFRPQSALYLSYIRQSDGSVTNRPYTFSNTLKTIDQYAEQRFLVKVSYQF